MPLVNVKLIEGVFSDEQTPTSRPSPPAPRSAEHAPVAGHRTGLPAPIGPYSQAVRAGGLLFVSGQPGIDPATGGVAGDGFGAEARQAFKNLETVLQAGGSRLDLVASTTVLVADLGDFAELNELYAERFPVEPPARMVMQVPLPRGLRISIGCVAAVEG